MKILIFGGIIASQIHFLFAPDIDFSSNVYNDSIENFPFLYHAYELLANELDKETFLTNPKIEFD
jgi:hypothetical protein